MSLRRRILTASAVGLLSVAALSVHTTATAAPVAPTQLPTAAIAVGDSFISGEGAGDYQAVTDVNGVPQGFPGWSAPNSNAFFCHRSANASINRADLPGVSARFNLACSGGQPHDMANPSQNRESGRTVAAQIDQVRAVAQTHDIDVVLVGLGSNNSSFTFGDVAVLCANRFIADAWTGWWEFWAYIGGPVPQEPCAASDLASDAEIAAATTETTTALRGLLNTLREVDADGQHRIVFQDYTNPMPLDLAGEFHEQDGRSDTRDKFRDLGAERYAAGCPIHRASLAPGHFFSAGLGTVVRNSHATLSAEFPGADLVYLNVQNAFNGARLCENPGSPGNALATPIRLHDGTSGTVVTSLSGKDKIAIQKLANNCVTHFQTCQESWHPNASGHGVLGQCLTGAAATGNRAVTCSRNADGSISVG